MGEGGAPEKSGGIGGMGQAEGVFGDWPLSEETLGTNPPVPCPLFPRSSQARLIRPEGKVRFLGGIFNRAAY